MLSPSRSFPGSSPGPGALLESAASLCALPTELVLAIIADLAPADLNALAQTSRRLHQTVNPALYQHNVQQQGSTALTWACTNNRPSTLPHLHRQRADFNGVPNAPPGWYGTLPSRASPMHLAAKHGRIDILRWLLDTGRADLNALSIDFCLCRPPSTSLAAPTPKWTPLHTAVCHNQTAAAIYLLSRGADTIVSPRRHPCSRTPRTPRLAPVTEVTVLHAAAAANNLPLVDHLLTHTRCSPSSPDSRGLTPLHYAARRAHAEAVIPRLQRRAPRWPRSRKMPASPFTMALLAGAFGSARLLHRVAEEGDLERILEFVVSQVEPRGMWEETREVWAEQREGFVVYLLECGARAGGQLHRIAEQEPGLTTVGVFRKMLMGGAAADGVDGEGRKVLYLLAGQLKGMTGKYPWRIPEEVYQSFAGKVEVLQRYGARVMAPEGEGEKKGLKTLVRFMGLGEGKGQEWHVLPPWRRRLLGEVLRRAREVELDWWTGMMMKRWAYVFVGYAMRGKKLGVEGREPEGWMFLDGLVDKSDLEGKGEGEDELVTLVREVCVDPLMSKLGGLLD